MPPPVKGQLNFMSREEKVLAVDYTFYRGKGWNHHEYPHEFEIDHAYDGAGKDYRADLVKADMEDLHDLIYIKETNHLEI